METPVETLSLRAQYVRAMHDPHSTAMERMHLLEQLGFTEKWQELPRYDGGWPFPMLSEADITRIVMAEW